MSLVFLRSWKAYLHLMLGWEREIIGVLLIQENVIVSWKGSQRPSVSSWKYVTTEFQMVGQMLGSFQSFTSCTILLMIYLDSVLQLTSALSALSLCWFLQQRSLLVDVHKSDMRVQHLNSTPHNDCNNRSSFKVCILEFGTMMQLWKRLLWILGRILVSTILDICICFSCSCSKWQVAVWSGLENENRHQVHEGSSYR